jgi:hypothetical protein
LPVIRARARNSALIRKPSVVMGRSFIATEQLHPVTVALCNNRRPSTLDLGIECDARVLRSAVTKRYHNRPAQSTGRFAMELTIGICKPTLLGAAWNPGHAPRSQFVSCEMTCRRTSSCFPQRPLARRVPAPRPPPVRSRP